MKKITRIGIGGPVGSGKTAIVEAITPPLLELGIKVLIITNDVVTTEDAKHVQRTLKGVLLEERILGVETGACPHTAVREDPSMNLAAVEDMEARFPDSDVVLIESGGDNLTLTFSPALVDFFIYVIDVAAGDKIPRKNGPGHLPVRHPGHQQDRPRALRRRESGRDGARLGADARRQAVPVHQLPHRRRHTGAGRRDPTRSAVRSANAATPRVTRVALAEAPGASAPELASFQDEPEQMASGAVGKSGYLKLGFERRGPRTILATLDQRVPYLVQRALYYDDALPDMPHVFVITTSGCVLQGDRFALEIYVAQGARAHVTTQAATKIHSMDRNYAASTQGIRVDDGAYLELLPEPTIPHRRSRFIADTRITIGAEGTLLYSEITLCGRKHHRADERFGFDVFSATIAAKRPDGRELLVEKYVIEPNRVRMDQAGRMHRYDVFANVMLLTPPAHAKAIRAGIGAGIERDAGLAWGASRLPNDAGLALKVLGMETEPVKAKVREFWSLARRTILGVGAPREFLWR